MEITSCILEVPISFSFHEENKLLKVDHIYSNVCVRFAVIFTSSYGKNS